MAAVERVDVAIVGAGPTGLTAASLCRRLGLRAVVLEQRAGPQRAPAAHVVNARSFEIWRHAGLPMDRLLAEALPPAAAGVVHWVTRLGGEIVGTLPFERQGDDMLAVTPTPLRNLSQHRLEPLLAAGLDVRYDHRCASVEEDRDVVTLDVEAPEGRRRVVASYVLGADGAASSVRRALGIEMNGPRTIRSFVMVHVGADFSSLAGEPPGVIHFVVDPAHGGTFVSHGLDREWVYMQPWDPDDESFDAFTAERCREIVRGALADPDVPFEVLGTSTWHMSAQIAARYRAGRCFLVGDAAHRFPPTGGLGLNSGVGDAHNLVWKLAAVEAGWAAARILDTYEEERLPVARFNSDQSLHNAMRLAEVPVAFGFDEPERRTAAAMEAALRDPARRAAIERAIANQAIHFDLLGLQLGYSYTGPLVIDDGSIPPVLDDPARDYVPSTRPGGRLPHAWLDATASTLDLVDPAVPTVLHQEGSPPPDPGTQVPTVLRAVPGEIWTGPFGLQPDDCLVVRPDQHVAARRRAVDRDLDRGHDLALDLARLFGPPGTV
jgi:2-polyprenyl-6-methoxyphenol hydroxylase-like FAD-dependent oxidoreductase